jgi:predicted enzyme related to lactoylglutathione lyase
MNSWTLIWAGLYVEDLEKSIAFYQDVLGFNLVRRGKNLAKFELAGGMSFELLSGGKLTPEAKGPERQSLVLGFRVADLGAAMRELSAKGVHFIGDISEYKGQRWVEFMDLEGNRLEIKEIATGDF